MSCARLGTGARVVAAREGDLVLTTLGIIDGVDLAEPCEPSNESLTEAEFIGIVDGGGIDARGTGAGMLAILDGAKAESSTGPDCCRGTPTERALAFPTGLNTAPPFSARKTHR